jgi:hypothetical protein
MAALPGRISAIVKPTSRAGPRARGCQTKFYTACLRAGTGWSSTVFAHESSPRAASFEPENGLYSFALTMPVDEPRKRISPLLQRAVAEIVALEAEQVEGDEFGSLAAGLGA